MHALALVVVFAAAAGLSAQAPSLDPRTRRISSEMNFHAPQGHCDVAAMAGVLSRHSGIPLVVEHLPGRCETSLSGARLEVRGRTIADVLDQLVALDPRYRWRLDRGVMIVRPVAASDDPDHFLHREFVRFIDGDLNPGLALALVNDALGPMQYTDAQLQQRSETWNGEGRGRFSIALPAAPTGLDFMTAVARAHGHMFWQVSYCLPEARRELSTFMAAELTPGGAVPGPRSVRLYGGVSGDKVYLRDAQGRRVDPCAASAP